MFLDEMKKAAELYGIPLTDEQLAQFDRYSALLLAWNEKMNLTAITAPKEVAIKHMIDSLTAYDPAIFRETSRVLDVGTGAGFPGIPLKILCPQISLTLMDSLKKRIRFLAAVKEELPLENVALLHARMEDGGREKAHREQYDIVLSRAVARLPVLAEYTLPFAKVGGVVIAMKGMKWEEELEEAKAAVKILGGGAMEARQITLPEFADARAIIKIPKIKNTPKSYPRKAGTPAKQPLGISK